MTFGDHISRRGLMAVMSAGVLLMAAGCIRTDYSECARETLLYVVQQQEGDNPVSGAVVYLFDGGAGYSSSAAVSGPAIAAGEPVDVSYGAAARPKAVVWANMSGGEDIPQLAGGMTPDQAYVKMKKDIYGYRLPLDNLFYGAEQLSGKAREEIVITPKTGRMAVTAKGLPYNNGSGIGYYATVESEYGGYDFNGTPLREKASVKLSGTFNAGGEWATPRAGNIVHYPQKLRSAETAEVRLWEISGGSEDRLIASADRDTDGALIVPRAGETINVLFDMRYPGGLEVRVVITGWNEVHQWSEW